MKWNELKWSEVQCREGGKNETLGKKFVWVVKWWEVKGWGESVSTICVGKNTGNCRQYFLTVVLFTICTCCILRCLVFIIVSCLVCNVVVVLCVLLSSYVYLLYYACIAVLTSHAGLLARSQYPEGHVTSHLNWGFSWFPCVYKQMLRWFPRFQVATTCFSCSPPNLTLLWYHGVYVTPVLFDSLFFLNCHEYWYCLLCIFRKAFLTMSHTFGRFCVFLFIFYLCLFPLGVKWTP